MTRIKQFLWLTLVVFAGSCIAHSDSEIPAIPSSIPPTRLSLTPIPPAEDELSPLSVGAIARVWANEGGDKVIREELRASQDPASVLNSIWDGAVLSLFGAGNEVVAFNLVLEAPVSAARNVTVALPFLEGTDGFRIAGREAEGDDLWNFVGRDIELFYLRYLQIKGLSTDLFFAGFNYDERHIPERCRRPLDSDGEPQGNWSDRPCHDQLFPEIAVPLELETPFDIPAATNQSIWGDIYIPPTAPAGLYQGLIEVRESGQLIWQIPLQLEVLDFALPDLPASRTMVYVSRENIKEAYSGNSELSDLDQNFNLILDRHFQLAHRHKISLIDSYLPVEDMDQVWLERLTGELFTEEQGYDGPGVGVGNNVYSIGTYGEWPWMGDNRQSMWENCDQWVAWFEGHHLTTPTEYFLYLIDESDDYRLVEKWARWIIENPGVGNRLLSLATIDLPNAVAHVPSLSIPAAWASFGISQEWESAARLCRQDEDKRLYLYNSNRPATGSFAIEDEGTALRQLAWTQYKMEVDRWFYWESTYYDNFQCYGNGPESWTNVFQQAQTFGCLEERDPSLGETGWNYLNGDGVLFYPGTDSRFPDENYRFAGPLASLRLKLWRRGIQDVDYLVLAAAEDPDRTAEIVNSMIPSVLWELGVAELDDPTYVYADISWTTDPDNWEAARRELAEIILFGAQEK
jgi:hypothetical protein